MNIFKMYFNRRLLQYAFGCSEVTKVAKKVIIKTNDNNNAMFQIPSAHYSV